MASSAQQTSDQSQSIAGLLQKAKRAARGIAKATTAQKNEALRHIAYAIESQAAEILKANSLDMQHGADIDLTPALLDRLELTEDRINAMAAGCLQVAELDDPVGALSEFAQMPSGIKVGKMRVPLGVIGIIYESRPNVTVDAAVLCLKSGNAAVLRGGSEAIHSNLAIAQCIAIGLEKSGLDMDIVQVIETTDRAAVGELITANDEVDIIIPRGGKNLIARISQEATVPVIKHLDGICHVYIDRDADNQKAITVAYNAKARRYGICGSMETLLVDEEKAETVLPVLSAQFAERGIELRGCERSRAIDSSMLAATEEDWRTEYLDGILSIRIVQGVEQAMAHIAEYGSDHTDSIITENRETAERFMREVDSSSVMWNASTQFADGFEYGLGAEIGISTNKLHVRGPVGLEGLTNEKYVVIGDGTIRP